MPTCPGCATTFSREDGYWLSALILNFAVTEAVLAVVVVGGLALAAPEFSTRSLLVVTTVGVVLSLATCIAFYPYSKLLWLLLDDWVNPRTDIVELDGPQRPEPTLPERPR